MIHHLHASRNLQEQSFSSYTAKHGVSNITTGNESFIFLKAIESKGHSQYLRQFNPLEDAKPILSANKDGLEDLFAL